MGAIEADMMRRHVSLFATSLRSAKGVHQMDTLGEEMNALAIFNYGDSEVRTVSKNSEPWFVGKDVADILGYANTRKAVRDHCKMAESAGGNDSFHLDPQTRIIPEADVYRAPD